MRREASFLRTTSPYHTERTFGQHSLSRVSRLQESNEHHGGICYRCWWKEQGLQQSFKRSRKYDLDGKEDGVVGEDEGATSFGNSFRTVVMMWERR
jgi:hypothetical protein